MKFILLFLSITFFFNTSKWGVTGHRAAGEVAEDYVSEAAMREVSRVLGDDSIAMASTWMDEIRSDPDYDHTHDWHWVTIPDGMRYSETEKNPAGDLVNALETSIQELKNGDLSESEEREKLKYVIHLVGDIHQPLHVGTGDDQGGNAVRLEWMGEPSNLHRIWDSDMIDGSRLSYTEFAESINHPTWEEIEQWQEGSVRDWAYEVMKLRDQVYEVPDDGHAGYEYQYRNFETVERQVLKAGIRLAGILNDIYE